MKKILVVSERNSCRSQIAEGWLGYYGKGAVEVYSAGIVPTSLNHSAANAMVEAVIDISNYKSKGFNALNGKEFDYVLLLSEGIKHVLPVFKGNPRVYEYPFPDVEGAEIADDSQRKIEFARLRDELENFCFDFIHHKIKPLL
jgi:arsenate reductase